jgi:hypothetical protein
VFDPEYRARLSNCIGEIWADYGPRWGVLTDVA